MRYENAVFTDQIITLDGHTFVACTFANCTLVHEGGAFAIENGFTVRGTVEFDLRGGESTIKMLDLVGRNLGYVNIMGRIYRADDKITD